MTQSGHVVDLRHAVSVFDFCARSNSKFTHKLSIALNAVEQRRKLAVALTVLRDVVGRFATACEANAN
jgi:hypothetical protein